MKVILFDYISVIYVISITGIYLMNYIVNTAHTHVHGEKLAVLHDNAGSTVAREGLKAALDLRLARGITT